MHTLVSCVHFTFCSCCHSDHSPIFRQCLAELQRDDVCQKMSLNSFLLLPMQRVTRLPLLVAAIMKHCPPNQPEMHQLQEALAAANTVGVATRSHDLTEAYFFDLAKFVLYCNYNYVRAGGGEQILLNDIMKFGTERCLL